MDNLYQSIEARTGGDIYIGVVGPVRTGKSTFIQKFMENLVLPNIEGEYERTRAQDELPQSAGGKTVMTTEPKFIPADAVSVNIGDAGMKVRLIDCVGYMVDGAAGSIEGGTERMVKTPWNENEMPFSKAAELGTEKVICDHSTIGIVITTDGSFTDIDRSAYAPAEERVVSELKGIDKPFIVLLNSANPGSEQCTILKNELENKYGVPVIAVNCARLSGDDINNIIEKVLFRFPLSEVGIDFPDWVSALDENHYVKSELFNAVKSSMNTVFKVSDIEVFKSMVEQNKYAENVVTKNIDLGTGKASVAVEAPKDLFYQILGESAGVEVEGEGDLMRIMKELTEAKGKYDRLEYALSEVARTGYGIVFPDTNELRLEEPEIVKQGGQFGVKLRAGAPSIHMIRADIETEVSPLVGSEKQSQDLVQYLLSEFEADPARIWETDIFGKPLYDLVNEGLHSKLAKMPFDAQQKLRETLERIINEGSGGLICIIL